jgi:hypothetical protein
MHFSFCFISIPRAPLLLMTPLALFACATSLNAQVPDAPSFALEQQAANSQQKDPGTSTQSSDSQSSDEDKPQRSWIIRQTERPFLLGAPRVDALTFKQQTSFYVQQTFGPTAFLLCTYTPAITMAFPKAAYPKAWKDGGGAYARNYGDVFATEVADQTGKYLTAALVHEDPRYFASESSNVVIRSLHAIAFTIIDHGSNGNPRFALSNFAGAISGGFVGRAYLPRGFNDTVHALQRSLGLIDGDLTVPVLGTTTHNLIQEFTPELHALARKMHLMRAE